MIDRSVVSAAALAAVLALAGAARAAPASAALCEPAQRVMFHCSLGARSVSLCADMTGERIDALSYRYGRPGRIELTHTASAAAGQSFAATVAPLAPRASVRQLWFKRGDVTYLLSQCVGSDCPQAAGLAVLRGERVVSSRHCVPGADDRAWFAPRLARFGSDAHASRSLTAVLRFDDVDQGAARFYPR